MWDTRVRSLSWEDPLEKEMATYSRTLAWKIPWTEEPGRLQSMGSQKIGHGWATSLHFSSAPVKLVIGLCCSRLCSNHLSFPHFKASFSIWGNHSCTKSVRGFSWLSPSLTPDMGMWLIQTWPNRALFLYSASLIRREALSLCWSSGAGNNDSLKRWCPSFFPQEISLSENKASTS